VQQFSNEFIKKWEDILNEVNTTEIPLECIKKVVIKLRNRSQKTINLSTLRRQGLEWEEIKTVVSRALDETGTNLRDVEFIVDIGAVAEMVQPETDRLLNKI
jgi:hypothetical protein